MVNYEIIIDDGFFGFLIMIGDNNSGKNVIIVFVLIELMEFGEFYIFIFEYNIGCGEWDYVDFVCFV